MKARLTIALGAATMMVFFVLATSRLTGAQEAAGPEPAAGAPAASTSSSEQPRAPVYLPAAPAQADGFGGRGGYMRPGMGGMRGYPGEMGMPMGVRPPRQIEEIQKATAALRDADTDEARAEARQQLADMLETYFDEDMRRREEELAKIEQRVRTLRQQLDRRQSKKQEIIDLQVQVAVNEAEGLGFFNSAVPDRPIRWEDDLFRSPAPVR